MKRATAILITILFVMAGCGENEQSTDDLITVDVTKSYPKKELILQDILDVEYIPLETNTEFITQGLVQAIGKDIILVKNRVNDGDIFIYDRNGKGLKKINRRGQGPEEYTYIMMITLDEDNGEMFVNDIRNILVYDLDGNFKRSFRQKEGTVYEKMYNFDRENLICYNGPLSSAVQTLMIVSKQDGSITKEIQIPFEEKKLTMVIPGKDVRVISVGPATNYPIIPSLGNFILAEPSSDTVYRYSPDHSMVPFITRTPSVQSMDPEVFLFLSILTDRYYFMETVKKEYDFKTNIGYPATDLMYDKQEKALFEYTVYNDDYSNKEQANMKSRPAGEEIATWQLLEAHQLVEANEKGELKGRLKEVAAELDEEDNPVIMLLKYKK